MTAGSGGGHGAGAGAGALALLYARAVRRAAPLIVLAWLALALGASFLPRQGGGTAEASIDGFVPSTSPSIRARERDAAVFVAPLLTDTLVVQRRATGLPVEAGEHAVAGARAVSARDPRLPELAAAIPVPDASGLLPFAPGDATTIATFLYFPPVYSVHTRVRVATSYARRHLAGPDDSVVGVTGAVPARAEAGRRIEGALSRVEMATVLAILAVLLVRLRSPLAPAVALLAAGVALVVTRAALAWGGDQLGLRVPADAEPIVVVLVIGVVCDYAVFLLHEARDARDAGLSRAAASELATARVAPIVLVAGTLVAASCASLRVANLGVFDAIGPALAISVVLSVLVALSLVPALVALLGDALWWPRRRSMRPARAGRGVVLRRPGAAALVATVVLVALAVPLAAARLAPSPIGALPDDAEAARAARAAGDGFAPGIVAPTVALVEGRDLDRNQDALRGIEQGLARDPGVAAVVGPADLAVAGLPRLVAVSADGRAARFLVVLRDPPFSPAAMDTAGRLDATLASLVAAAPLAAATGSLAGGSSLARETVAVARDDLVRIVLVALALNLGVLLAYLRRPAAAVLVLVASALGLAAAFGVTALVFIVLGGQDALTYYTPLVTAVLLLSLGADYSVFVVGRIRQETTRHSPVDAIAVAARDAGGGVATAALALAASFALLGLVPLKPFRELAVALGAGVLIDAFVVRSVLVPALLVLLARRRERRERHPVGGARVETP